MKRLSDFSYSLIVLVIMFIALIAEHTHNSNVITERDNTIYELNKANDQLYEDLINLKLISDDCQKDMDSLHLFRKK